MSSKDDITTISNREMRFQQIARQCKYNSQPFQTRHLVQNTSQMHSKFKLQISTRGRKVLKRPPCSFKQDSNLERIYLERRWSPPTMFDFFLSFTDPSTLIL